MIAVQEISFDTLPESVRACFLTNSPAYPTLEGVTVEEWDIEELTLPELSEREVVSH